jgi:hypothetical protein
MGDFIFLGALIVVASLLVIVTNARRKRHKLKLAGGTSRASDYSNKSPSVRMAAATPPPKQEPPIKYPYARPLWEEDPSWVNEMFIGGRVCEYLSYKNKQSFDADILAQLEKSPESVRKYVFDRRGYSVAFVGNCDYYDDVQSLIRTATDEDGIGLATGYTQYMEQVLKLLLVGALKKGNFGQFFRDHLPHLGATECDMTPKTITNLIGIIRSIVAKFPELG